MTDPTDPLGVQSGTPDSTPVDQRNDPLAAPVDRAIAAAIKAGVMDDDSACAETLRDDILAEIRAEFGPIREEHADWDYDHAIPPGEIQHRLVSDWRAEK